MRRRTGSGGRTLGEARRTRQSRRRSEARDRRSVRRDGLSLRPHFHLLALAAALDRESQLFTDRGELDED